ncbi:MAG: MATE family efflux transporter [Gammaproteobacteria bacterium]
MRVTPDDILNGPIAPVLRRMTIPMIYGIAAMFLFQTVDLYFISLLGTHELAAISFTFPVTFTVISLTIGITIALSIIVGKAIGGGRKNTAARITTNAMLLGIVVVFIIAITGLKTVDGLFTALGAAPDTIVLIHEYIDLWYLFCAFLVVPYIGNSAIRATGDTVWPSLLMIGSGVINIILDPLLIFGIGPFPEMGMRGAAVATVIAWVVSFAGSIWLLGVREKLLVAAIPNLKLFIEDAWNLFRLGAPISLANMAVPLGVAVLTKFVAAHGEEAVAAFGTGSRIESFAMVVSFALTSALSPYMAQNFGANNSHKAKQALSMSLKFGFFFQLATYLFLILVSGFIGRVFSDDPAVVEKVQLYLWIMPIGGAFYALFIVYNTAFNASGNSGLTLGGTIVRLLVLVIPLAYAGNQLFGLPGIFAGVVIGNALSALCNWWLYKRYLAAPQSVAS